MDRKLDSSIRRFQGDMGLKVDGIMNPGGETERSLQRSLTRMESDQPDRISIFEGVGNNQTNRKEDVAQIQRGLSSIGLVPKARSFEPSGIIDAETTDALQSLQRRQGLKVDSMLRPGGETERTLNVLLSAATKTEGKGDGDKEPASPPPPPDKKPEPPQQKDPGEDKEPDEKEPDNDCKQICINLENTLDATYDKRTVVNRQMAGSENEIKAKKQEIEELQKEIDGLDGGIPIATKLFPKNPLTIGVDVFSGVATIVNSQKIAGLRQKISELKTNIAKLKEKNSELQNEFDAIQKRIEELIEEINLRCPCENE